ncbi:hypothetical protein ACVNSY_02160 [Bacillus sp. OHL2]
MQNFVVSHVPSKEISEQVRGSVKEIYAYLSNAIAERRKEKKNDLLSRLISETPGVNGELTDDQLIAQTMHLIFGVIRSRSLFLVTPYICYSKIKRFSLC